MTTFPFFLFFPDLLPYIVVFFFFFPLSPFVSFPFFFCLPCSEKIQCP